MSTPSLPNIGDVVADKYRIDAQLGEGGMAVVFGAHHMLLDKPIAVKILSPELPALPQVIERFLTEARAAARVDSPNVARVMDVGVLVNGLPYMVMERLDGCDLEELLRLEKQLTVGDAVDYVLQALQGLAHAHTLGVVHRDLKPANIFLSHQPDGTAIIKILDFGIAKMDKATRTTGVGQAVGSPTYMSPSTFATPSTSITARTCGRWASFSTSCSPASLPSRPTASARRSPPCSTRSQPHRARCVRTSPRRSTRRS